MLHKRAPQAQISYDRFHVIAMTNEVMDGVRRQEMSTKPKTMRDSTLTKTSRARGSAGIRTESDIFHSKLLFQFIKVL